MTPAIPEMIPASKKMIRMMWDRRNPMARKMPISSVRSRTLPIMVTSTTSAPMKRMTPEMP